MNAGPVQEIGAVVVAGLGYLGGRTRRLALKDRAAQPDVFSEAVVGVLRVVMDDVVGQLNRQIGELSARVAQLERENDELRQLATGRRHTHAGDAQ
jgi:hypothetical protein